MFRLKQFFDAIDSDGGKLFLLLIVFLVCLAWGGADLKNQAFAAFIGALALGGAVAARKG